MTVRPSPEDDRSRIAHRAAEHELREPAVTPSGQARAGSAEGVDPGVPAVDERSWWEKQLGIALT